MILGSAKKPRKIDAPTLQLPRFQVNDSDIDLVKETKYLCLMIDGSLK